MKRAVLYLICLAGVLMLVTCWWFTVFTSRPVYRSQDRWAVLDGQEVKAENMPYIDAAELKGAPEMLQKEYTQAVRDSSGLARHFEMAKYGCALFSIISIVLSVVLLKRGRKNSDSEGSE